MRAATAWTSPVRRHARLLVGDGFCMLPAATSAKANGTDHQKMSALMTAEGLFDA